jgi:tetratricopeptide (TPR) repeat protein
MKVSSVLRAAFAFSLILAGVFDSSRACTIVMVSKDGLHLAGNNEDWRDLDTWIWFYPPAQGEYGRVCWGHGAGFSGAQGGMNDQGLFLDANALTETGWKEDASKPTFRGPVIDYILAHCANVEEALAFFAANNVPSLALGKIPIADAQGNSAVVEWGQEKLQLLRRTGAYYQISTNFVQSNYSKLEDYPCSRYKMVDRMLKESADVSLDLVRATLAATHVEMINPTTYSTICDLGKRRVYLYNFHNFEEAVVFDLPDELKKGRQEFRIPSLFKIETMAAGVYKMMANRRSGFEVFYEMIDRHGLDYFVKRFYEIKGQLRSGQPIDISEGEMSRLGRKLLSEGRMEEGIKVLEINAAEDPTSWKAREQLADAYERAGKPEQAIRALKEAISLAPDDPERARKLEYLESVRDRR